LADIKVFELQEVLDFIHARGPEAVLRQPLEDMKVFECPEVLEFNQVRGAPE